MLRLQKFFCTRVTCHALMLVPALPSALCSLKNSKLPSLKPAITVYLQTHSESILRANSSTTTLGSKASKAVLAIKGCTALCCFQQSAPAVKQRPYSSHAICGFSSRAHKYLKSLTTSDNQGQGVLLAWRRIGLAKHIGHLPR